MNPPCVNYRWQWIVPICFWLTVPQSVFGAIIVYGPFEWSSGNGGNGHWYQLSMPDTPSDGIAWTAAKIAAESDMLNGRAGHLATVTSAAENEFLRSTFSHLLRPNSPGFVGDYAWIGLSDAVQEGNYEWVTGEPFSYSNWHVTEPNDLGGMEDYVHYWVRDGVFSWNDEDNTDFSGFPGTLQGYFTEFDGPSAAVPEPSSMAVWSIICVMALGHRAMRARSSGTKVTI